METLNFVKKEEEEVEAQAYRWRKMPRPPPRRIVAQSGDTVPDKRAGDQTDVRSRD